MRDGPAFLLTLPLLAACQASAPPDDFRLLISDVEAGTLSVFEPDGGLQALLGPEGLPADLVSEGFRPAGMALVEGRLLLTDTQSGRVLAVDPQDGRFLGLVFDPGAGADLEEPCALAATGDRLAVLGNDTRNVLLLSEDGAVAELGGDSPPEIRGGHGLASLPDGRLVVATSPNFPDEGLLQVWDPQSGERLETWLPPGELLDATGVSLGPDGLLYVVDWTGAQVLRVDPADGHLVDRVLGPEDLEDPVASAFDPQGRLWVLERRGLVRWSPLTGAERVLDDAFAFGRGLVVHLGG